MKQIKQMAEEIRAELEDAEHYAKTAAREKETDRTLSGVYAKLAEQELGHANILHEQAQRLIRESGEEAPESMKVIWDWEHERMLDREAKVRVMLEMLRS